MFAVYNSKTERVTGRKGIKREGDGARSRERVWQRKEGGGGEGGFSKGKRKEEEEGGRGRRSRP